MARTFHFKEATIALVADKALVPASKLLAQGGEDGLAVAGVFAPLLLVEADNVTTILDFDFFELQRCRIFGLFALGADFDRGCLAFEHHLADLFGPAHSHPDDVTHRRLHPAESRKGRLADHAPISDHAKFAHLELRRMRSMTGSSVLASVVLPGHISEQIGRPSTSTATPTIS